MSKPDLHQLWPISIQKWRGAYSSKFCKLKTDRNVYGANITKKKCF